MSGWMDGPMPERIQRRRTKGWRMPEGAVYVGRPTLWGNPWALVDGRAFDIPIERRAEWVVRQYRRELQHWGLLSDYGWYVSDAHYAEVERAVRGTGAKDMAGAAAVLLRGHDLACWCPLCELHADGRPADVACPDCPPCHADVLLELANA
jgi:hypothetical protein